VGLSPPPAGRVPFLSPILPAAEDRHCDLFTSLPEAVLDYSPQLLREVVARDENGGLGRNAGFIKVADGQACAILAFLCRLMVDSPVDSLSGLPQPRRAFDEQPPDALSVPRRQPPEKEPLHDLAQPVLGLLSREKGCAGDWL
jgi:hypothetical protein